MKTYNLQNIIYPNFHPLINFMATLYLLIYYVDIKAGDIVAPHIHGADLFLHTHTGSIGHHVVMAHLLHPDSL